uniref:Zinc ribbon 1 n=2 Tax=Tetraselmis sp. GSL018 TaxID=582737 RepID=A0A061SAS4_9CHLO|mmetsp:Transcript_24900/g.59251  ORF Transcript_24900/g.59251 Transcript_24900/m.59251 type:complete len:118 (+) Transcript_24900:158-511(+)
MILQRKPTNFASFYSCRLQCKPQAVQFTERRPYRFSLKLNKKKVTCSTESRDNNDSEPKQGISVSLPNKRRTTLLTFTCNQCGARTQRLVNPVALERGLVFAQCEGCQVWHKIAVRL